MTSPMPEVVEPDAEVSLHVDAPAERVYDLVSDLPRMGEWSPECVRCVWLGGATGPAPGARFRGHNRRGPVRWRTRGRVVVADPGTEFAFDVRSIGLPVSRWRYRIESTGEASCRVSESWEDRRGPVMRTLGLVTGVRDRRTHNEGTMATTLERLKEAAEAG